MELELVYNEETGEWEQKPEPFITIEVETEEDVEFIGNAVAFYKKHLAEQENPKTNADRIRAMSDEELAKNLVYEMCNYCYEHRTEKCYRKCADNMLEWLKQPAYDPPKEEAQQDCTYNKDGHCIGQKLMPECDTKNCDRRIER